MMAQIAAEHPGDTHMELESKAKTTVQKSIQVHRNYAKQPVTASYHRLRDTSHVLVVGNLHAYEPVTRSSAALLSVRPVWLVFLSRRRVVGKCTRRANSN